MWRESNGSEAWKLERNAQRSASVHLSAAPVLAAMDHHVYLDDAQVAHCLSRICMNVDSPAGTGASPQAAAEVLQARSLDVSLTVNDLQTSLAWYRDVLGFTVDQKHEREGKLMAVSLRAGSIRVLIGQDDGRKGADRVKGEGFSMQIITAQDIDAIANRVKAAGGTLDTEPADMPWGVRMFRLQDPDKFKIVISSERPDRQAAS